ncbi:TetR family transcriptional regulator [Actinomadura sp. HBU206391]|uniref:acyl-CoA-like ligand-binding transcription factor n=1 Tax=Actinomadura sp. HBU206391 TaxID=2731692 RepID=UPI0016502987|nr:TetR family transcriptional regulator [Actinomadura sp. HBU206391]MBC6457556.1 TetR family transcriptional regulator [Actinomadura sp. HBU206391]
MSTPPREQSLDRHFERLGLRERKKLKTRRAIQEHALRLFIEQGYDATTVEQISEAAEISPSTFFRYFPTKEDVVVTDEYDPIMAEVFREQPPELTLVEAMRRMFRQVLEHAYASDREMITARVLLILSVPALRARSFDASLHDTYRMFLELVSERVGRPRDDFEVQVFGQAVIGALQAVMIRWAENGAVEDLPELVDRALEFLAAGCPLDDQPA